MVDRVLFSRVAKAEVDTAMLRAGKSGWAPMPVGFRDLLTCFGKCALATDCSAFDWTYPAWIVKLLPSLICDSMQESTPAYRAAVRARIDEVLGMHCTLRLPDGTRFQQSVQGIMKSGWLLTISKNSDAQELATLLAWSRAYSGPCPRLWAMGDDVIMNWPSELDETPLVQELARAGLLSKFAIRSSEFSGFRFKYDGDYWVDPLYPDKHRFLLAHTPSENITETVTSYGYLYALASPEVKAWIAPVIARYSRWPPAVYRAWAFGLLQDTHLIHSGVPKFVGLD